jgi:Uma2 family endonuclease
MGTPAIKEQKFTYADYLTWEDDERRELIQGIVHDMSPAPYTKHQRILLNLSVLIKSFLKGKDNEVFIAPFDIRLPDKSSDDDKIYTVVQPDISVFCDRSKIDKRGAIGAPDWIIEILSRSTQKMDTITKLQLYSQNGVREYWIVDPDAEMVLVHAENKDGRFQTVKKYIKKDKIQVNIFSDLIIDGKEVFTE